MIMYFDQLELTETQQEQSLVKLCYTDEATWLIAI